MSLLCLDIGNTRSKAGVFDACGSLLHAIAFEHDTDIARIEHLLAQYSIGQTIISSVADDSDILAYLQQKPDLQVVELSHKTPLPFQNLYATPQTLGKDRLAAVAGAHYQHPQCDVLVIDAGTCIKFDVIDRQGRYYGGSIAPGIAMQFNALHHFTQRLPLVPFDTNTTHPTLPPLIGTDTQQALISGVINGTAAACSSLIDQYNRLYPDLKVLITGGDAHFFETTLKNQIFAAPNLLLYGLYYIFSYQSTRSH